MGHLQLPTPASTPRFSLHLNKQNTGRSMLGQESSQFRQERQERISLLHERQAKEVDQFDEESTRLGFSAIAIAECSKKPGYGEENISGPGTRQISHSASASSIRRGMARTHI